MRNNEIELISERDLGYGTSRRDFLLPAAGYLRIRLRTVEHEGRVACALFELHSDRWVTIHIALAETWKEIGRPVPLLFTGGQAEIRLDDDAVEWARRDAIAAALGETRYIPATDSDLIDAEYALSNPLSDFVLGEGCDPAAGQAAIATLVQLGEWGRILNVLRGSNPEGRRLALDALQSAANQAALDDAARATLPIVAASAIPLRWCEGGATALRQPGELPVREP